MAGHNKWSKVKHKKNIIDAKNSKIWTSISKEISAAVQSKGVELSCNPRLRRALDNARSANMSNDAIERAITKGAVVKTMENCEELAYDGRGHFGAVFIAECLTDNRNKISAIIRNIFIKNDVTLCPSGSLMFMFEKKGIFKFNEEVGEKDITEIDILNRINDISKENNRLVAICSPFNFHDLKHLYDSNSIKYISAEVLMAPKELIKINDKAKINKIAKFIEALNSVSEVKKVWTNVDFRQQ